MFEFLISWQRRQTCSLCPPHHPFLWKFQRFPWLGLLEELCSRNNTTPGKRVSLAAAFNPAETFEVQLFRELRAQTPIQLNDISGILLLPAESRLRPVLLLSFLELSLAQSLQSLLRSATGSEEMQLARIFRLWYA